MGSTPPNRADFSASRRGSNIAPDSGHDFVDKRLEVTPSQIQELVETNKALREMVIAVTALLSDPSRGAQYQSECRLPTERPALNYKELNDYRYEDVELMTPKELEKDTQGRIRKYKGRQSLQTDIPALSPHNSGANTASSRGHFVIIIHRHQFKFECGADQAQEPFLVIPGRIWVQ